MAEWYCNIGGKQYGPVNETDLKLWVDQGRVRPSDLVWREGMTEWAPAGSIPWLFASGYAAPPVAGGAVAQVQAPAPAGTDGNLPNYMLTARARDLLRGNWGLPIAFSLLLWLMTTAAGMVPYVGWVVQLVLAGPFALSAVIFYVTLTRGGRTDLGMLFSGFPNFGKALAVHLLVTLIVLAWTFGPMLIGVLVGLAIGAMATGMGDEALLIGLAVGVAIGAIPGIILAIRAQLSYSQAQYLLGDERDLGVTDALRGSKTIMQGRRAKLFLLGLRFLGWGLLCLLTCGIGFLWLTPYMLASFACFYDDLHPPAAAAFASPAAGPAALAPGTLQPPA